MMSQSPRAAASALSAALEPPGPALITMIMIMIITIRKEMIIKMILLLFCLFFSCAARPRFRAHELGVSKMPVAAVRVIYLVTSFTYVWDILLVAAIGLTGGGRCHSNNNNNDSYNDKKKNKIVIVIIILTTIHSLTHRCRTAQGGLHRRR